MDINRLVKHAKYVIEFSESSEALKVLKELRKFIGAYNLDKTSPQLYHDLIKLEKQVRIVAFPVLPDEESAKILQNEFLESFSIDFPMEKAVTEKLFLEPYGVRRELREMLRQALLQNNQIIGGFALGQWLKKFDQAFDYRTRDESAIVHFLTANPSVQQITEREKTILKKTLHLYDSLLIYTPIADEEEQKKMFDDFKQTGLSKEQINLSDSSSGKIFYNQGLAGQNYPRQNLPSGQSVVEKMTVKEALKKYPDIGEQIIALNQIKLKQFDRSVRPSIKNWLHDYTSQLGQERHSSVERMRYLFNSENGKNLSSPDREKLAIILKSFDEDVPLAIDAQRQEVVFAVSSEQQRSVGPKKDLFIKPYSPADRTPVSPKVRPFPSPASREIPQGQTLKPEPDRIIFTNPFPKPGTHEMPDSDIANIRFSEPSENQAYQKPKSSAPSRPVSREPAPYKFNRPPKNMIYPHLRREKEKPEPKIDGNVVDLSGSGNEQ